MEEESAFACSDCHFTTKDSQELEEHAKTHELGEQCPLCSERPTVLNDHLIADHKIAESAVEKLLAVHRADIQPVVGVQFAFRCPQCPLAFRSETALQTHSLAHIFKPQHACPVCAHQEDTAGALVEHMNKEHPSENTEERRLRCELCQESFADKKAMLSHLNSVNHLHRAKKQLEQQGGMDLNAQLQALAALNAPASPSERKPFRCNVCKIGYGQGATLDIHLRSVAHQSRMSKIAELVTSGDIDPSRPVLEQPGGPQQRLIRDLVSREEEGAAAQQNAMAMFNNILNMAQLLQMAGGQNAGFPGSSQPSISSDTEEDVPPKTANALKAILEVYGLDQLSEAAQIAVLRLDEVPDDRIAELSKVDCDTCGQTCVSVLALRSHCEDSHDGVVPDESINKFGIKLQNAIDEIEESVPGSRSDSRPPSRDNSEPPEKRSRTESSSTPGSGGDGSQAAQLALLNMMQAGFPFMPPNPFMPMEGFFNPLMAQQMASMQSASSPAKRARTKITDDQLKVLRTYFDINNSPTEAQIHEMSLKTQLPEKVIKHWFRNTLFKERQRDKDSPYNFSNPPQMSIDLDTYDKTGETKVTLNSEPVSGTSSTSGTQSSSLDIKKPVKEEPREIPTPSSVSSAPPVSQPTATVTTPSLAALIGLQQQNPFAFMQDEKAFSLLTGSLNQLPSQHQPSAAGRRANRTRFTDFQLRTLQQFFDKQAYPKDDDLEVLSKKLQLSPRVIVVWFQNARQKARKIYENQPNAENNDRFVRTPGCNFQCKRCQLVFQRYYELIQHQQKKCYKDDSQALLQDNKSVEDNLTDEERMQIVSESRAQAIAQPATPTPADILKLLGQGKSSTEALLKMCESARTPVAFHKRCPFCCLLFRSRQSLADHLPQKHPEQMLRVPVDVDLLPSADDVPSLSSALLQSEDSRKDSTPLDLSSSSGDRADSLSVSPYLGGSDGDDNMDDSFSSFGRSESQGPGGASRSPASNKRYRTHLTPMQVHMMKYIFSEYKTPSMSECEALGRDIGLHKRVVQVWFQNARAKERKSRMQNGQDEDMSRSTATSCTLCGVEYSGRLTMQDHLFSATHLAVVRAMHKGDADPEPRPTDENGLRLRTSTVRDCHKKSTTPLNSAPSFPFNLMNFGLQPGGLSMIYDPTVMGTPIPLLQIPESVMTQITSDMSEGKSSTKFTQDGLSFDELLGTLDDDNARCAAPKDCEVGWACPGCSNVFQQESLLKNHQRAICTSTDSSFTLIQTHYECIACETQFGSQSEYRTHLDTPEHVGARAALLPLTAVSSAPSAATPLAGAM